MLVAYYTEIIQTQSRLGFFALQWDNRKMFLFNLSFSWGITALLLRFCLESLRDITDEKGNGCSTVLLLGRVKCLELFWLSPSAGQRTEGSAARR